MDSLVVLQVLVITLMHNVVQVPEQNQEEMEQEK
jgi:hypothetical protein